MFCPSSQEGVDLPTRKFSLPSSRTSPAGGDLKLPRSVNQSNHVMQIRVSSFSPIEGVELCSKRVNQSEMGMQIRNRRPVSLTIDRCLRPESIQNSQTFFLSTSHLFQSHHQSMNLPDPILPPDTNQLLTANHLNSPSVHPIDSQTILNSTAEQTDLLTFVENFPLNSPSFRRLSPRPPMRSRQLGRISRLDQIRQHNRTRERAAKTRFVAARTTSRKEGHNQLLEAIIRCCLSRLRKVHTAAKIGVFAVDGSKPILSKSKEDIVGLPGLFDADLLAELTEEDRFLGPMNRAIVNKDVTTINKLGAYMTQFWPKAAVVNNCVIIDNKLAIPEASRQAVLARLHRSHSGQEAMLSASEYIWWVFLNRQIVNNCEKCREGTLYGKNIKPAKTFHTAQTLPNLSGPNQELQLDFAGPILDDKGSKLFLLIAIDRFSKFPSVLITKTTGAKKITNPRILHMYSWYTSIYQA